MRPKSWALAAAPPRRWATEYTDSDRAEMDLIGVKAGAVVVDSVNGAPRPGFTIHWYPKAEAKKKEGGAVAVEGSSSPEAAAAAAAAVAVEAGAGVEAVGGGSSSGSSAIATAEEEGDSSDVSFFDKSNEKG